MAHSASFVDRFDAGRQLAARLSGRSLADPVVYALPRGGVPVGYEIARALHAPLDLLLVRKIGAAGYPELALGAVAEGEPPLLVVNEDVRRSGGGDDAYLERAKQQALDEIERRKQAYRGGGGRIPPAGRTAIVVDDGLATGATARAAIRALRADGARKVILAVPVAPPETAAALLAEADEVVCLAMPTTFHGVGQFYDDFHQLSDAETVALLHETNGPSRPV